MRVGAMLVPLALALSGCGGGLPLDEADARLPGVRSETFVDDEFACGPLLVAAGCVLVRIQQVSSGCVPEVPGYARCDANLSWTASSGSLQPGARLVTAINGTAGPACDVPAGGTCTVGGGLAWEHGFDGPDDARWWNVTLDARLEGPPDAAAGWFRLTLAMKVRTEPLAAADA